ncbi:jg26565, partial [Pararge aegeria aegeria]
VTLRCTTPLGLYVAGEILTDLNRKASVVRACEALRAAPTAGVNEDECLPDNVGQSKNDEGAATPHSVLLSCCYRDFM